MVIVELVWERDDGDDDDCGEGWLVDMVLV